MKKWIFTLVVITVILGCDNNCTSPGDEYSAKLQVYFNNELIYYETLTEADNEQTVTFNLPNGTEFFIEKYAFDDEYMLDTFYRVLARIDGFYSKYYECIQQEIIVIDASEVFTPVIPNLVCGSIIDLYFGPYAHEEFYILQDSLIVDSLTTTDDGYFAIDIPFGEFQITFKCAYPYCTFYNFIVDNVYINYLIDSYIHVDKPNIYIYPEENTTLDVTIDFPKGGSVIESIPEYGNVWKDLQVEPSGLINGTYNYLFYESANPDLSQYENGWVIAQEDLETFFIKNMAASGFYEQEITDFIDYWLPLLKDYPYYAIYPQYNEQLEKMIQLNFSQKPDNILRLVYTLKGLQDNDIILQEPVIPKFKREGFVVVEWGVIRKFERTICLK